MTSTDFSLQALARVRGVLFDLDGTLYHQDPVRRRMALELILLPIRSLSPSKTRRVWSHIKGYRRLHERMRDMGHAEVSLRELQVSETARQLGVDVAEVDATVSEWMIQRPLPFIARAVRADLGALLDYLTGGDLALGVLSDYPVEEKLRAMGIRERFSLALCSSDTQINALKPNPRGLHHARAQWGLEPEEVLYVGDRADVDAGAARAAGMPCAIISSSAGDEWTFPSMNALQRAFEAQR
ncbi:MAG: FMN phosphatase YigB (HAD superfamily) [Chlamydiales bacterium]